MQPVDLGIAAYICGIMVVLCMITVAGIFMRREK